MAYSIAEAANLLDVSPLTLRAWLSDAEITPEASPADKRSRMLTREQIEQLAREHKREVVFPGSHLRSEEKESGALPDLRRQVAFLESKIERQDQSYKSLETVVELLREQNKRQYEDIDDLRQRARSLSMAVQDLQSRSANKE